MPLSADSVSRIRKHIRSVRFEGHALHTGGEVVRLYFPRWRREAKTDTD